MVYFSVVFCPDTKTLSLPIIECSCLSLWYFVLWHFVLLDSSPDLLGSLFPKYKGDDAATPTPAPAVKHPAVPATPKPAAPALWHRANQEPDTTAGPCREAAMLPAATPALVNPTAPRTRGAAAIAASPPATGSPTSVQQKTLITQH